MENKTDCYSDSMTVVDKLIHITNCLSETANEVLFLKKDSPSCHQQSLTQGGLRIGNLSQVKGVKKHHLKIYQPRGLMKKNQFCP